MVGKPKSRYRLFLHELLSRHATSHMPVDWYESRASLVSRYVIGNPYAVLSVVLCFLLGVSPLKIAFSPSPIVTLDVKSASERLDVMRRV